MVSPEIETEVSQLVSPLRNRIPVSVTVLMKRPQLVSSKSWKLEPLKQYNYTALTHIAS